VAPYTIYLGWFFLGVDPYTIGYSLKVAPYTISLGVVSYTKRVLFGSVPLYRGFFGSEKYKIQGDCFLEVTPKTIGFSLEVASNTKGAHFEKGL
jgi:hypothetical protein